MRVNDLQLCAAVLAFAAVAACTGSGGGGRDVLPNVAPASITTCSSAKEQPGWIFKGACQMGTIGSKGTSIVLEAYEGYTVGGSIAKTNLRKASPFVVVDATGNRDIVKNGGKAFPKYAASGFKTLLYLQFVNGGASPITIAGKPAIRLSIVDDNASSGSGIGSGCGIALLTKSGSKTSWTELPIPVKFKDGTYSIKIYSLPTALNPGAAYFALACRTTAPSPSPTSSPTPSPTPSSSIVVYNPLPHGYYGDATTGVTAGPDGNVWFTSSGYLVGKISPTGTFATYPVRDLNSGYSYTATPVQIVSGSDGNLWFTANSPQDYTMCGCIFSITPDGVQTLYRVPESSQCGDLGTEAIASGPDGNIWFSAAGTGSTGACSKIGRFNVTSKNFTMFDAGNVDGVAYGLTSGPDGNLWFTDDKGYVGRMTTSGTLTTFSLSDYTAGSAPSGIVAGSDGNLWFTLGPLSTSNHSAPSGIGRITTNGTVTEFADPTPALCTYGNAPIIDDGSGNLWFGCGYDLAKSTTAGSITDYPSSPLQDAGVYIQSMAFGSDGNFWLGTSGGTIAKFKQ